MINDGITEKLDRFTRGLIRRKVKQLVGRAGITRQDGRDLEQELLARVVQSLPRFEPEKSHRNVFVTTVVERHVANILRNKRAAKRDPRRISSLNVMIKLSEECSTELAQTIGDREQDARLFRERRSEVELAELAMDLSDLMTTLPAELSHLAVELRDKSISQIAREQSIPRTTINDRVRILRQQFEKSDLRSYL